MKKLLCLLSLVIMVVGCSGGAKSPEKLSLKELIKQEGKSTVALVTYRDDLETTVTTGYRPFCTGVWVDSRHILTADHCAKGELENQQERLNKRKAAAMEAPRSLEDLMKKMLTSQEPDVLTEQGLVVHYVLENEVVEVGQEPSAWHASRVIAYDEAHDLALLEAEGSAVPSHRVAKLADKTPEIGESVHVVGHTIGMYWTYVDGTVSAYRGKDLMGAMEGPWMQVSAPVYFGNSGGGAFNDCGELVGIADWIKRAPNMSFFVHLSTIKRFLSEAQVAIDFEKK